MDTQVVNKNVKNESVKESLKKSAALAGAAGLGAGAVVSADIIRSNEELDVVEPISSVEAIDATNAQTSEQETSMPESNEHVTEQGTHTFNETVENHTTQSTESQPQTSSVHQETETEANSSVSSSQQSLPHTNEIDTNDIPNVDPDLVAHDITDNVIMIDSTDNDLANLDIAAVGTIETVDGQVLSAAQFTGDNGETLYAIDVDGDNTYDVVSDELGNVLAEVPSTLTVSDSESIVSANNGDNGYLAQNEHDNVSDSDLDNPMDDVVDLG